MPRVEGVPRLALRVGEAAQALGVSDDYFSLHVAPELAVGGPLALVQDGDLISLDAKKRRLDLVVDDAELERRRAEWTAPDKKDERGYRRFYEDHVLQANEGCDFDFLRGRSPVVADVVTYL